MWYATVLDSTEIRIIKLKVQFSLPSVRLIFTGLKFHKLMLDGGNSGKSAEHHQQNLIDNPHTVS